MQNINHGQRTAGAKHPAPPVKGSVVVSVVLRSCHQSVAFALPRARNEFPSQLSFRFTLHSSLSLFYAYSPGSVTSSATNRAVPFATRFPWIESPLVCVAKYYLLQGLRRHPRDPAAPDVMQIATHRPKCQFPQHFSPFPDAPTAFRNAPAASRRAPDGSRLAIATQPVIACERTSLAPATEGFYFLTTILSSLARHRSRGRGKPPWPIDRPGNVTTGRSGYPAPGGKSLSCRTPACIISPARVPSASASCWWGACWR
jgi:hypothetical protein